MNDAQETYETTAMNYHNKTEETTLEEDVKIDRYFKTTTGAEISHNFSTGKNDEKIQYHISILYSYNSSFDIVSILTIYFYVLF